MSGSLSDNELQEQIIDICPSFFLDTLIAKNMQSTNNLDKNIGLITGGDPSIAINQIFSTKNKEQEDKEKKDFLYLNNEQISSLVPEIRIFKTYYTSSEKIEIELPFEDISNKKSFENMFKTKIGRGSGFGLTSFEWNSMAKNEANMAQYSAKLKFHVQDVTELDKIRNSKIIDNQTFSVSLLDLIYPNLREAGNLSSFSFDRKKLAIKMMVGWKNDNIYNVKKYGSTILNLTLIKHGFNFNEDGSLDVEIEYVASTELDLRDSIDNNVVFSKQEEVFNSIHSIIEDIEQKLKQIESQKTDDLTFFDYLFLSQTEKITEETKKEARFYNINGYANTLIPRIRSISKRFSNDPRYSSLFAEVSNDLLSKINKVGKSPDKLVDNLVETLNNLKDKLKNLETEIKKTKLQEILENLQKNNLIKYYLITEDVYSNLQKIIEQGQNSELSQLEFEEINKEIKSAKKNAEKGQSALGGSRNELAEIKADLRQVIENSDEDDFSIEQLDNIARLGNEAHVIVYLSLYDILREMFSTTVFFNTNKLFLGQFTYKDYDSYNPNHKFKIKKVKNDQEEITKVFSLQKRIANIGHIPITLKSFINWYNSQIVNKNIKKFSPMDLFNSIFSTLIPTNIKNNHIKFLPSYSVRHQFRYAQIDSKVDQKYNKENNFSSPTEMRSIINENELKLNSKQKVVDYIFIFSRTEDYDNGNGNFSEDWDSGIYHFLIGEERGLMKNMKFSREDNARLETVNINAANPENNNSYVRQVYNCDIQMFGNNIFEPGSVVFISPTYPGIGLQNDIMFQIGLGGYYRVINVDNIVESGNYETQLKCRWESFGKLAIPGQQSIFEESQLSSEQRIKAGTSKISVE